MGTLTIPLVTLPVGARVFGPANIADTDTGVTLTLDRTVANGLTATPAAHIDATIEQSGDGGATWFLICVAGIDGGVQVNPHGQTQTANHLITTWAPGISRQARTTITVSGVAVAIAGTLVTS